MNIKKTLIKAALPVLCVMFVLTAAADGVSGSWVWSTFDDAEDKGSSKVFLVEDYETIDGKTTTVYKVSGEITNKYQYGYAGWRAVADDHTKELLKKAKSFSFKILGDGQSYHVMYCTSDIKDTAYYRTIFNTKKDRVTTINVKVSSLAQPTDWGVRTKFNQNNAFQIQWQTTNNGKPGTFKLKVYDLKLYME